MGKVKRSDRNKVIDKLDRMNGIKKMKKRTLSPKQLKSKYEHVIRDLIIIRDKNRCQIEGLYHECFGRLVADHRPVKRGAGNHCFFDPSNLTTVCANANYLAENRPAVSKAICDVVVEREGIHKYDELLTRAKRKPFKVNEEYVLGVIATMKSSLENRIS